MKRFNIKEDNNIEEFMDLSPLMFIVFGHFLLFAQQRNLPVTVTNITNKFDVSISNTHPEGRAIDISTRGWTEQEITSCLFYLDSKVGHLGAYSSRSGKQHVAIHHDSGLGPHFHLQVKP